MNARHYVKTYWFLAVCIFCGHALWPLLGLASPLVLDPHQEKYPLGTYLEFLEDREGQWTLEQVRSSFSNGFVRSDVQLPNFGFTSSAYWVRFQLTNPQDVATKWLLEIGYPQHDHITAYFPTQEGTFTQQTTGRRFPFRSRELHHSNFVFVLDMAAQQTQTVYLRFQSEESMQMPLVLWTPMAFMENVSNERLGLGVYYGIMLVMLIYNLFVFFAIKDKTYLYYVWHVGCYILFQMIFNGLAFQYLWPNHPHWAAQSLPVFACLSMFFVILFCKNFLNTAVHIPHLDKLLTFLMGVMGIGMFLPFLVSYQDAITVVVLGGTVFPILMLLVGIQCWRKGVTIARYYLLAWISFLLGVLLLNVSRLTLVPTNFLTEYGMQIGSALEVILLSLALADKINFMRREKEIAQSNALRVQQQATEHLEEKVIERTETLQQVVLETQAKEQEIVHINQVVQLVNSTLELDKVMSLVMEVLQDIFTFDQIGILLIDQKKEELVFHKAYGDGFTPGQIRRLQQVHLSLHCKDSFLVKTVFHNEPTYISSVTAGLLEKFPAEDRAIYEIALGKSYLFYPLAVQHQVIGVIAFGNENEAFSLEKTDLKKIQRYITQIATAINNAQLYKQLETLSSELSQYSETLEQRVDEKTKELKTTAAVQHALFPKALPQAPNLEIASFFQAASEAGGDWYGFMTELKNKLYVLIGDVTGHGTPSALVTATACATCRTMETLYALNDTPLEPRTLLHHLNRTVCESGSPDYLMTFFVACIDLDTGMLTFANAGHNFPLLIRNGQEQRLMSRGKRLGDAPSADFAESSLQLEAGDLLFFYTDGLTENENLQGKKWGERKLFHYLKKHRELPIQETVNKLMQDIYVFRDGCQLEDDVTVVGCQVTQAFKEEPKDDA